MFKKIIVLLLFLTLLSGCNSFGTGNLEGTLTWQYNPYVGTKGDVGAKVALIPADLDKDSDNYNFAVILSQSPQGKNGIYTTKADGYGHYHISDIPAGKYYLLLVSNNASGYFDKNEISFLAKNFVKPLFSDEEWETLENKFMLNKHEIRIVEIERGKTKIESFDFGNTVW